MSTGTLTASHKVTERLTKTRKLLLWLMGWHVMNYSKIYIFQNPFLLRYVSLFILLGFTKSFYSAAENKFFPINVRQQQGNNWLRQRVNSTFSPIINQPQLLLPPDIIYMAVVSFLFKQTRVPYFTGIVYAVRTNFKQMFYLSSKTVKIELLICGQMAKHNMFIFF